MGFWSRERRIVGKQRRCARAEVRPDRAAGFVTRIRTLPDFVFECARRRFGGLLQAAALDVVEPAVIDTTQSAVFHAAVAEVGAAMRALAREQPRPPGV